MMNESEEINFWPSFVDLMLFVMLLFILVFSISFVIFVIDYTDLKQVSNCQRRMLQYLTETNRFREMDSIVNTYRIQYDSFAVVVTNELHLQRIRVSAGLLFGRNEYIIKPQGMSLLAIIGNAIKKNLDCITRIQIEGHADIDPTRRYKSNLHLAGLRAFEVFYFLTDSIKIDPARVLLSTASFGEFKPVGREEGEPFDSVALYMFNKTEKLKRANRRVEFLLFYKSE